MAGEYDQKGAHLALASTKRKAELHDSKGTATKRVATVSKPAPDVIKLTSKDGGEAGHAPLKTGSSGPKASKKPTPSSNERSGYQKSKHSKSTAKGGETRPLSASANTLPLSSKARQLPVGTLVFAKWQGRYHLGTIASGGRCPGGDGTPVEFSQGPAGDRMRVLTRVDDHFIEEAGRLGAAPDHVGAGTNKGGRAQTQRESGQIKGQTKDEYLWSTAKLEVGQWVSVNWASADSGFCLPAKLVKKEMKALNVEWHHLRLLGSSTRGPPIKLRRESMRPIYSNSAAVFTKDHVSVWPQPQPRRRDVQQRPAADISESGIAGGRPLKQPIIGGYRASSTADGWRTLSGFTSIKEIGMFREGPKNKSSVKAYLGDLAGVLDVGMPNEEFLAVWRTRKDIKPAVEVKILNSEHFDVKWHKAKRDGIMGIAIVIQHDDKTQFTISTADETAATHVARRLVTKLQHATVYSHRYAGNAKNHEDVE